MGWIKGKKRGPQSPEQIENAKLARRAAIEHRNRTTVRVSRNDAAMLEVARKFFTLQREFAALAENPSYGSDDPISVRRLSEGSENARQIAYAWLDGDDVLLAKLAQA